MTNQKGIAILPVLLILIAIAAGGYGAYKFIVPEVDDEVLVGGEMMEEETMDKKTTGDEMMEDVTKKEDDSMVGEESMMFEYSGKKLAGTSAPLLDFNKADYEAALKTDKLIVLYFYANWCPICREEIPKLYAAFNELATDNVVGFRVNYNDNETDNNEVSLAREYGVAYQHTKVFVRNGERIGKWPDSWDKNRYLSEINARL